MKSLPYPLRVSVILEHLLAVGEDRERFRIASRLPVGNGKVQTDDGAVVLKDGEGVDVAFGLGESLDRFVVPGQVGKYFAVVFPGDCADLREIERRVAVRRQRLGEGQRQCRDGFGVLWIAGHLSRENVAEVFDRSRGEEIRMVDERGPLVARRLAKEASDDFRRGSAFSREAAGDGVELIRPDASHRKATDRHVRPFRCVEWRR